MQKAMAVLAVGLAVSVPAIASAAPYGMAGCGLGSIVFGDQPGFMQVFAATTNGTSASQTFGITSGTSNCIDMAASASLDQKNFVKINYASLMRDSASGQGEYLSTFATLLGCEASVHSKFFGVAQSHQADIFTEGAEPAQVLERFKATAAEDEMLRASCTRI